jgi:hypothetical protein
MNVRQTASTLSVFTMTSLAIVLVCAAVARPAVARPASAEDQTVTSVQFVQAIRPAVLQPQARSEASAQILQAYYESLEHWGQVVRTRVIPVPDHDTWNYIGLVGNVENDVRPTAYAAMVLTFLSECQPPEPVLTESQQAAMRAEAVGLLRYLTGSHVANGGTCLNGKPWGNQWQSALWARAVAMAAWQVWPHLDEDLKQATVRLIEFEADRFVSLKPKSSVRNDTGAEENAWNASMPALACNMMPQHPQAEAWSTAAKKYMYNTFSVRSDAQDTSPADDGLSVNQWVTTVNAHDDFTVENHRLVHVGYLKNSAALLQENAIHWSLTGQKPPLACQHHIPEVFDLLANCMNWNAAPIYFGGNDWRIYETQCSDVIIYSILRQLTGNRRAAYLEDVALQHLRTRQVTEGGYYNFRRDLEYGGMCATRLISCFYAHAATDALTEAMPVDEFNLTANNITKLESARTVIQRTSEKFASFTWAQKRMALAIPSSESSVVWPHFASYLGLINGEDSSYRPSKLQNLEVSTTEDGFQVSGTLIRCKGQLQHEFFYASPKAAYTIYVERLRPAADFQLTSRETGVIGLEYAIGNNQRNLSGRFGHLTTLGTDSEKTITLLTSDWLNIDDRVGYVVRRTNGQVNVMRHHDNNVIAGRKPHLQEYISLIGDESPAADTLPGWSCVVTFLNQDASQTQASSSLVQFSADGETGICRVGDAEFTIDFSRLSQ